MIWLAVIGLVLAAGAVLYAPLRDFRRTRRILSLHERGDYPAALASPPPRGPGRHIANVLRSQSAVLSGRFAEALESIEGIEETSEVRMIRESAPTPDIFLLAALLGVGRYAEAADHVGDDPRDPTLRHIRAQAAIEVGDDELAERLLSNPDDTELSEAGRLRILGDFRIRRGRIEEGRALVGEAMDRYERLATHRGVTVDRAYCLLHLAEAALAADDIDATDLIEEATALMAEVPHHADGHSHLHSVAAEVAAARRDPAAAERHLDQALHLARLCSSPPLIARALEAAARVAARQGHSEDARAHCREALGIFDSIGAAPAAAHLRETFDPLG